MKADGRQAPGWLAGSILAALLLALAGCAHQQTTAQVQPAVPGDQVPAQADASAEAPCASLEDCGIEVRGVRLSAADYILDFRYKVVDAAKAARVIHPRLKLFLEVESNGARLMVPSSAKVGALRQTRSKLIDGRTYFVFFANPGKYVKPGEKVRVVMGDVTVEHLTVQ